MTWRAVGLVSVCLALSSSSSPPNVVVLLMDDVGWGDVDTGLGMDPPPAATMPEVRALASAPGAVVFSRAYCGGAVCSPTRASLQTGRSPTRDCIYNVDIKTLPPLLNSSTLGGTAKSAGYATGLFGKWHLGALSSSVASPPCYTLPAGANCSIGYLHVPQDNTCCDGRDFGNAHSPPTGFGYDTVTATAGCAPSSTTNCGCLFTVKGGGEGCNLGHYAPPSGHSTPGQFLSCEGYFRFNGSTGGPSGNGTPLDAVSPVDDAEFLVDEFEAFARPAVAANQPILAVIAFHGCHVPYIAPPAFSAPYVGEMRAWMDGCSGGFVAGGCGWRVVRVGMETAAAHSCPPLSLFLQLPDMILTLAITMAACLQWMLKSAGSASSFRSWASHTTRYYI